MRKVNYEKLRTATENIHFLNIQKELYNEKLQEIKHDRIKDIILKTLILSGVIISNLGMILLKMEQLPILGLNGCIIVYLKEKFPSINKVSNKKEEIKEIKEYISNVNNSLTILNKELEEEKSLDKPLDFSFANINSKTTYYNDYNINYYDNYCEEEQKGYQRKRK